jgi:anti-sigma-K factor RskA
MESPMVHESCKEMLAVHALSALDASDQRELQEHLATCDVCRRELAEWQAAAAALAYVAAPVEPSAQLRERILERVRDDDHVDRISQQANVLNFSPAGSSRSRWPEFAAIAASIIFIALVTGLIVLWRQNRSAGVELARLSRELHVQEQKLASDDKIMQILTTRGARSSELLGTKDAPNAHALLAVDRQSGRTVLLALGLPPAPSGKAYQLWFIAGGQAPAPGKVFTTDAIGNALLEDQLPANAHEASIFAVTLEPQAGVPAPTGSMYLLSPANGSQ